MSSGHQSEVVDFSAIAEKHDRDLTDPFSEPSSPENPPPVSH